MAHLILVQPEKCKHTGKCCLPTDSCKTPFALHNENSSGMFFFNVGTRLGALLIIIIPRLFNIPQQYSNTLIFEID
jgi:hypothetical protein